MGEAETIAKGLTKAQRKAVKLALYNSEDGTWRCEGVMFPCDCNLRVKGLATGLWLRLTPLGLEVRRHLEGADNDEG